MKMFGFEIVRRPGGPAQPPPLLAGPIDALLASRAGADAAFACPVDTIVMLNGFGFGTWHPFAAALAEHRRGHDTYAGSLLERFYAAWTPADAGTAVVGFAAPPACLRGAPPHGYHFTPWTHRSLEQELAQIEQYHAADAAEHGHPGLRLEVDGFKHHGPVSAALGAAEYARLARVQRSLAERGFDRAHGDVNVYLLRRGAELRAVCRGGVHRVAAMKALGHATVPARLREPFVVDVQDRARWPQVASGRWPPDAAARYFDLLFDGDATRWASHHGLAPRC